MTILWLKAFHIIFVVTWFAALFYLPRLFVYHVSATDQVSRERFSLMELKLAKFILLPSSLLALGLGIAIIMQAPGIYMAQGWLHAKLTLVFLLFGYQGFCTRYRKQLANDTCTKSERFFRIFNEVPAIVLVSVVILAVVKPF